MREQKIGALIVSETHMSAAQALEVQDSFMGKHLKLFNYEYPENPATKGIAIVLNREITNVEGVKIHYLIPGKAILAVVPWHGTRTMMILGLYAPTDQMKKKLIFGTLCASSDLPVPDAIGGDFNVVLDAIDRLPHRVDSDAVVAAYLRFMRLMEVKDGWRQHNPDIKAYTVEAVITHSPRWMVKPMGDCSVWISRAWE
ncbi:hypothetical protein B0H13DRAFT_1621994 [Mycena leptocephala]|nr:hypothetical protein B0H13DRAFT_1621994 [Mycena leptocephala]